MAQTFGAQVGDWVKNAIEAQEAIFKESAQQLVHELDNEITRLVYEAPPAKSGYKRTGFLRASLVASKSAMPQLNRPNPGAGQAADYGEVILTIANAELGETIFLGYTANYGAYVHFGSGGVPPRPWVALVAQRWETIVAEQETKVKAAFGL